MSFLDLNLSNVEDLKLVPDGEYLLQCQTAEVKNSQKGGRYINLRFALPNEPTAEDLYHILMLPDNSDAKKDHRRLLAIKQMCKAMGVDLDAPLDLDDIVSRECYAILTTQEDQQYGDKNVIKTFVVGR